MSPNNKYQNLLNDLNSPHFTSCEPSLSKKALVNPGFTDMSKVTKENINVISCIPIFQV